MRAVGPVDAAHRRRAGRRRSPSRSAAGRSSAWAARRCAGTVELEAGRRYELDVDYPAEPGDELRPRPRRRRPRRARRRPHRAGGRGGRRRRRGDRHRRHRRRLGDRGRGPHVAGAARSTRTTSCAAVVAANPNTVVVLNTGSPVTMPWLDDVPAVLQLWFPGQEIGDALADVLTGDAEPGGRLPVTFPRRLEDTPAFDHYPGTRRRAPCTARGCSSATAGTTAQDIEPLFPFGFGLGYTTFELEPGAVAGGVEHGVTVDVDVTNTGDRPGGEVVQVYVEPPPGDDARPLRHLAGFARIDLAPASRDGDRRRSTGGRSPRGSTGRGSSRPASTRSTSAARPATSARRRDHGRGLTSIMAGPSQLGDEPRMSGQSRQSMGSRPAAVEGGVGPGERLGAEEAVVGRQRRRVRRLDDRVPGRVDERLLAAGVAAPEDEHDRVVLGVDGRDDLVGERLPARALVRRRLAGAHGQRRVEQQHALARPTPRGCRGRAARCRGRRAAPCGC